MTTALWCASNKGGMTTVVERRQHLTSERGDPHCDLVIPLWFKNRASIGVEGSIIKVFVHTLQDIISLVVESSVCLTVERDDNGR
jgi:hypothetical protein